MPTLSPPKPDNDQDSQQDIGRRFNDIANHPDNQDMVNLTKPKKDEASGLGDSDFKKKATPHFMGEKTQKSLASAEEQLVNSTPAETTTNNEQVAASPATPQEFETDFKNNQSGQAEGMSGKKKGLISLATGGGILGIVVAFITMFLGMFQSITVPSLDKATHLARLKLIPRMNAIAQQRYFSVPDADCTGAMCRLTGGVSDAEVKQMEKKGLRPVRDETNPKRISHFDVEDPVGSGTYRRVTAENFQEELKTNKVFRKQFSNVNQVKAKFFRTSAAVKKLARVGISRTNPMAGATTESEARARLRAAELGVDSSRVAIGSEVDDTNAENTTVREEVANADNAAAAAERERLLANPDATPDPRFTPRVTAGSVVASFGESAISGLKVNNVVDKACHAYSIIRTVDTGAKYYKLLSLLQYVGPIYAFASAIQAGDNVNGAQFKVMTDRLFTPDEDGKSFFDSDGMQSMLYGTSLGTAGLARFSTGSATGGVFSTIRSFIANSLGSSPKQVCKVNGNLFFQGAMIGVSILAAVATGGLSLGWSEAASFITQAGIVGLEYFAIPMLTAYAAGTSVISQIHNGKDEGDAFPAATGTLGAEIGRAQGMHTITKEEAVQEVEEANQLAALYEPDERSVGQKLYDNLASISYGFIGPMYSMSPQGMMSNMASVLGNSFSLAKASAADDNTTTLSEQCQDEDYKQLNIATDAYCNPIVSQHQKYTPLQVANYMYKVGEFANREGEPYADIKTGEPLGSGTSDYNFVGGVLASGGLTGDQSKNYKLFAEICMDNITPITVDSDDAGTLNFNVQDCTEEGNLYKNDPMRYDMFFQFRTDGSLSEPESAVEDGNDRSPTAGTSAATPAFCNASATSRSIGEKIACSTYQYDNYGYLWGGGHGESAADFMKKFLDGGFKAGSEAILDCSGLARMAVFEGTGVDVSGLRAVDFMTDSHFTPVTDKTTAVAGDMLVWDGHIEVIVGNDASNRIFTTFGAHTENAAFDKQVGQTTYEYDDTNGSGSAPVVVRYAQ